MRPRIVRNQISTYPGLGAPGFTSNCTATALSDGFSKVESTASSFRCFWDRTFQCTAGRRYTFRSQIRNITGEINKAQYRSGGTGTFVNVGSWKETQITNDGLYCLVFDCTVTGSVIVRYGVNSNAAAGTHPFSCEVGNVQFAEIGITETTPPEYVFPGTTCQLKEARVAENVGGVLVESSGTATALDSADSVMIFGDSFANDSTDWPQGVYGVDSLRDQKAVFSNAVAGRGITTINTDFESQISLSAYNFRNISTYENFPSYVVRPGMAVLAAGINDIVGNATLEEMQSRTTTFVSKCATSSVSRILLFDVPPFKNSASWTEAREAVRIAYNNWLIEYCLSSANRRLFKISEILKDGTDATALLAAYDSGDGMHPNATGMAAIAAAVEPYLFWGWGKWASHDGTLPPTSLPTRAPSAPVTWTAGGTRMIRFTASSASADLVGDVEIGGGFYAASTGLKFKDGVNVAVCATSWAADEVVTAIVTVFDDGVRDLMRVQRGEDV